MPLPRTIHNFNAFLDGRSYFGRATEAKLPQPKIMTEAHRGSGMDGPVGIDTGMEAMSAELTIAEFDPAALRLLGTQNRLVLRPAAADPSGDGADVIVASIGGLMTATEMGEEFFRPRVDGTVLNAAGTRALSAEAEAAMAFARDAGPRIDDGGGDGL